MDIYENPDPKKKAVHRGTRKNDELAMTGTTRFNAARPLSDMPVSMSFLHLADLSPEIRAQIAKVFCVQSDRRDSLTSGFSRTIASMKSTEYFGDIARQSSGLRNSFQSLGNREDIPALRSAGMRELALPKPVIIQLPDKSVLVATFAVAYIVVGDVISELHCFVMGDEGTSTSFWESHGYGIEPYWISGKLLGLLALLQRCR